MNLELMLILFQVVVLLFSFSVHESARAYATMRLGDATAFMLGRVSLNPIRHIDPWGSVLMPAVSLFLGGALIGWGKPIPVTTRNFRRIKRDDLISTLVGLGSHLAVALIALLILIGMKYIHGIGGEAVVAAMLVQRKTPMDLSGLPRLFPLALLLYYCVVINVLLFVFELIPVPPLDGSRLIRLVLPYNLEKKYDQVGLLGSFLIFAVAGRIVIPIFYPPLLRAFDLLLLKF